MMKYICKRCGAKFDEPHVVTEYYPDGDGRTAQEFGYCPECGDTGWETACECEVCGAAMPESQAYFHMCRSCELDADREIIAWYERLDRDVLEYLDEYRLGGWLSSAMQQIVKEGMA